MVFVTQNNMGGLGAGIESFGGSLGQVLQQRAQQQKVANTGTLFQQAVQEAQQAGPIGAQEFSTILSTVLSQGGDPATLKMFSETYAPQIKSASYAQATKNRRERYQPVKKDTQQTDVVAEDVRQEGPFGEVQDASLVEQTQQPELSPIEQARAYEPTEFEENQSTIETPSGILRTADFVDTPFGKYHPNEVQEMLNSDDPGARKEADLIYKSISDQEKLKGKEAAEIRKEWRKDIKEYNKPFDNVPKTKSSIRQLERAKELIASGKVSLDDNWMRNAVTAAIDDRGLHQVSELAKTSEQRELYSIIYNFLNSKGLGGSNPSTREVMLSLAAKPSGLKGEAENLNILDELLKEQHTNLARGEIANELLNKQGPISFSRYKMEMNQRVEERMDNVHQKLNEDTLLTDARRAIRRTPPKKGHTWMISPDGGLAQIPNVEIKRAENSGGRRINGK